MIIYLNHRAGSGKSAKRWNAVERCLRQKNTRYTLVTPKSVTELRKNVRYAYLCGETAFVAAGGDGTVNALLNALLAVLRPDEQERVAIGAIGLGSSNDFHKPPLPTNGGPCQMRIDFSSSVPRDVGVANLSLNEEKRAVHFLVNASVGLTAEGNLAFSHPGTFLRILRRLHTGSAIAWSAMGSIVSYRNRPFQLRIDRSPWERVSLTNLNLLKSPHVSGSLSYPFPAAFTDGRLRCFLAIGMGIPGRMDLLAGLLRGKRLPSVRSWSASRVSLSSERPFAVETDGEVQLAVEADFSVLPLHLKVCTC